MIRLMVLLLLASPMWGAFSYRRSITVNSGQVDSGPHTDFTMLVSGTYSYLATVANGGKVQDTQGDDIQFFTNSNCSTGKLSWERERYIATTGEVIFWVKISSINTGSVIYMCYGDASETADESDPTNTWDSNTLSVHHFPDGTTLTLLDSTANNIDGTNSGASATTGGKIGGAASFNGTTNYVDLQNNINPTSAITLSCWGYATSASAYINLFSKSYTSTYPGDPPYHQWNLGLNSSAQAAVGVTIGGTLYGANTTATLSTSTWYHIVGTYDGSNLRIYLNGSAGTPTSVSGTMNTYATDAGFGASILRSSEYWPGRIDECRSSSVARSAGWIITDYNSTNAPSSFYAVGSEENVSSSVPRRRIIIQ